MPSSSVLSSATRFPFTLFSKLKILTSAFFITVPTETVPEINPGKTLSTTTEIVFVPSISLLSFAIILIVVSPSGQFKEFQTPSKILS